VRPVKFSEYDESPPAANYLVALNLHLMYGMAYIVAVLRKVINTLESIVCRLVDYMGFECMPSKKSQ